MPHHDPPWSITGWWWAPPAVVITLAIAGAAGFVLP